MKLITSKDQKQLLANQARRKAEPEFDPNPVVHLYTIYANCDWLLTELDPQDPDIATGLCYLEGGYPEFGSVSLSELAALRVLGVPRVERDRLFKPKAPISVYIGKASEAGRIVL